MNAPVSVLLKRALHRCNAHGTSIAAVVLVAGTIVATMQLLSPGMLTAQLLPALPPLIGESKTAQLADQLALARLGTGETERVAELAITELEQATETVPDDKITLVFIKMSPALAGFVGMIVILGVSMLVLEAGARIAGMIIAGEKRLSALKILGLIPRFVLLWILLNILMGTWVSVILLGIGVAVPAVLPVMAALALLIPLLLLPRFAMAAPLLVKGHSVIASIRASWNMTKNRYGKVLTAIIGVMVTVFILERLAQIGAGYAIASASNISPYAPVIALVLPFLHVIGIVYRCAFVTVLAEELK